MNINNKNIPLIVAILVPVAMILFVAASVYLPSFFTDPPTYDFIYTMDGDYRPYPGYGVYYSVENGALVRREMPYPEEFKKDPLLAEQYPDPILYIHDVVKNESRQISFEEARALRLNSHRNSPDGFEVIQGNHGSDFPFFFNDNGQNTVYLKKGGYSKKVNSAVPATPYYWRQITFLGWVEG